MRQRRLLTLVCSLVCISVVLTACTGRGNVKRYSDPKPVLIETSNAGTGNVQILKQQTFYKKRSKYRTYLVSSYDFYAKNNTSRWRCITIAVDKQPKHGIQIRVRGKRYLFYREPRLVAPNKVTHYAMRLQIPNNNKVTYRLKHRLASRKEIRWKHCRSNIK